MSNRFAVLEHREYRPGGLSKLPPAAYDKHEIENNMDIVFDIISQGDTVPNEIAQWVSVFDHACDKCYTTTLSQLPVKFCANCGLEF